MLDAQMIWPLRPIMTSLNGDVSWLISFPRPRSDTGSKFYYHIAFEPWLNGPSTVFNSWLIHIALPHSAQIPDVEAIEEIASEIETSARNLAKAHNIDRPPLPTTTNDDDDEQHYNGLIDAILLFFHYNDHLHEPTLRLFDPSIPVIATPEAHTLITKMNHFQHISMIHNLSTSATTWQTPELHPSLLPAWLTAFKCPGHHELNFAAALVWTHEDPTGAEIHETILESPHGTRLDEGPLTAFLAAEPRTVQLALMHGLKESHALGVMNTLGAKGGLALYRRIGGSRYWIPSHHSELRYTGVMMRLLGVRDTPRTVDWALETEKEKEEGGTAVVLEKPNFVEVANGASLVLV